ncbi:DsrE/DsrF/TusD sulfur relay family protein [Shewanella marina]|uniref:DsrE/DsrF/TusD sulfur relay family protein n=1 Tax=Shewanella marina TaxID=487319 RepID=UPI000470451B|nr:DsrE family protein [Shewanella marina]
MQKIVIVAHASPYGTEKLFNSLRIALALKDQSQQAVELKLFLMSDAIFAALPGQQTPDLSYNIQQMLEILLAQQVEIKLCKTCAEARGVTTDMLIPECQIGTLTDLTLWTLDADKVIHI